MSAPLVRKIAAVAATLLLLALVVPLGLALVPQLLGYPTVVVTTGSMGDAVPIGSLAVLEERAAPSVRAGDIVLVRHGNSVTPVLHRAISLDREGTAIVVRTKGDANATVDPQPYTLPPEVPVHVATLPKIGYLVAFSKTPAGWFLLVVLPATLLGALILRAVWAAPERPAAVAAAVEERMSQYELRLREHAVKLEEYRDSLRSAATEVEQRAAAVAAAERALVEREAALAAGEAVRQAVDAELERARATTEELARRAVELEAAERALAEREATLEAAAAAAAEERAVAAERLQQMTADLRERTALAAAAPPAATAAEEPAEHLLFVPLPTGYELIVRPGSAPERGALVRIDANERTYAFAVVRVGRSPFPADGRRCAYLHVADAAAAPAEATAMPA